MKILFVPGRFPPELRHVAEALIEKWAPTICPHYNTIAVRLDDMEGDGIVAGINVLGRYRSCTIHLGPEWANMTADDREWVIVHELSHTATGSLITMVNRVIDVLPDESKAIVAEAFTEFMEGCTEDVARALLRAEQMPKPRARRSA